MQHRFIWTAAAACAVVGALVLLAVEPRRPPPAAASPPGPPPSPAEEVRRQLAAAASTLPRPVPTDPLAPGYSPERLLRVAGLDLIYAAEPRTEPWATRVETALGPKLQQYATSLVPGLVNLRLDCHTTICAVRWGFAGAPTEQMQRRWREILRQLFPGSGRFAGEARLVHWSAPDWQGDVRDIEPFIAVATVHLDRAGQYLRSSDGERQLVRVLAAKNNWKD
jgi:hypothetical protein